MTITEKELAEKLRALVDEDAPNTWEECARDLAELLGVDLAPEPKPLPTEPGDVITATEVRGVAGKCRMLLNSDGEWVSPVRIVGSYWHRPHHITAWTEAVVVPAGEPIDPDDVRVGDRVRLVLDNGDEATFTVTRVDKSYVESRRNAYIRHRITAVYLLDREGEG